MQEVHARAAKIRGEKTDVLASTLLRWSPRSMTGEPLKSADLLPLFEAARWAPSSCNNQPWRFHYALRGGKAFAALFEMLIPFNQSWCDKAGTLVILVSKTTFDHNGRPMRSHSHDAGAAWHAFAVEGARRNLVVHAMGGFDTEAAARYLALSEEYHVECMIALGYPAEGIADEEVTLRRPVQEIAFDLG